MLVLTDLYFCWYLLDIQGTLLDWKGYMDVESKHFSYEILVGVSFPKLIPLGRVMIILYAFPGTLFLEIIVEFTMSF